MIVYRVVFAAELIELAGNAKTQEEYTKNLDEARELVSHSVIEQFGAETLKKSTRMPDIIQKHDLVLDVLRIPIDNSTEPSVSSGSDSE